MGVRPKQTHTHLAQHAHHGLAREAEGSFDARHLHGLYQHAREAEWDGFRVTLAVDGNLHSHKTRTTSP